MAAEARLKALPRVGIVVLVLAAILFVSSGHLDWAMAWAYLGMYLGFVAFTLLFTVSRNPKLLTERSRITREDTKAWDRPLATVLSLGVLAQLLLAGLDKRFGWSPQIPVAPQVAGLVVIALAFLLDGWAMASNPFFSRSVCIQKEREHTVATGGPYRYVRHPGYVGTAAMHLATGVAFSSVWTLLLGGLLTCLLIVRTVLEDRTLQDELDGYSDYAKRVRYRLLPGIW